MEITRPTKRLHFTVRASRNIWLPALATTVLAGLYMYLAGVFVQATLHQPNTASAVASHTSSMSVASCTPSTFANPSGIDLATAPSGLTLRTEPVSSYHIYGNTAEQLRSEIEVCAPGAQHSSSAEFAGETSYTMTWQYDTLMGNSCTITNVKVGMHIGTALPRWEPTIDATSGLSDRWNQFINSLTTHEAGHAVLDKQFAAQVVTDLNSLPAMDCDRVSTVVKTTVNAEMMLLNQANNNYDASTDHGATQGAILPSH